MERCPRCRASLERLSLGEVSTLACNECGFADVPVDHEGTPVEQESWQDAFSRFHEQWADE